MSEARCLHCDRAESELSPDHSLAVLALNLKLYTEWWKERVKGK